MYAAIIEKTGWPVEYVTKLNLQTIRILSRSWSDIAEKQLEQVEQSKPDKKRQSTSQGKPPSEGEILEGTTKNAEQFAAFINSFKGK